MNCSFSILGSRLCSPNLKDEADLEDALLIFYFLSICPYKYIFFHSIYFFSREPSLPREINFSNFPLMISGKLEKLFERGLLAILHPSNFVNTIFYQVFKL